MYLEVQWIHLELLAYIIYTLEFYIVSKKYYKLSKYVHFLFNVLCCGNVVV